MDIAVFLQGGKPAASFFTADEIDIFTKADDKWGVTDTYGVQEVWPQNLAAFRTEIRNLVERISMNTDCKAVAGGDFTGIAFNELDRAGLHIFSIPAISDGILDGIVSDIEKSDDERRIKEQIILDAKPVETTVPGVWYLDLIALQTQCPDISSKKAMREFVQTVPFLELHLVCNHVPPWMERMGLEIDARQQNDRVHAVIRKRNGSANQKGGCSDG